MDLCDTLEHLRANERSGFYQTEVAKFADKLVERPSREFYEVAVAKGVKGGPDAAELSGRRRDRSLGDAERLLADGWISNTRVRPRELEHLQHAAAGGHEHEVAVDGCARARARRAARRGRPSR